MLILKILNTNLLDFDNIFKEILNRGVIDIKSASRKVTSILNDVRNNGLNSIKEQIRLFDNWNPNNIGDIKVSTDSMKEAYDRLPINIKQSLKIAYDRIFNFHSKQKQKSWFDYDEHGSMLGVKITPIDRAGLYIPGGKAAYPSSLLMNAIPAIVAGVNSIIVCSPANNNIINPTLLSAAHICGIKEMYKVGGASAIGMMAYGINEVKKVDIITGPGNIFVTCAKKMVFGDVNIDMIAGPSEIVIIADSNANPNYIAIDLLAQSEHDELASSILLTHSKELAYKVNEIINIELKKLKRFKIANSSINNKSYIIITRNIEESIDLSNMIAPEHLEIITDNPNELLPYINNAGAIFLGGYSPEAIGDYIAGPNHTLPTGGSAKYFSPLSVDNFIKKSSVICVTKNTIINIGNNCIDLANIEGLEAHGKSVDYRLKDINE